MPSFDVVSEIDHQALTDAVNQANRELGNRFDFQGVDATFTLEKSAIELTAPSDFQVQQMMQVFKPVLTKRGIDPMVLSPEDVVVHVHQAKQVLKLKEGIDQPTAKKIVKMIKDAKFKVQASIQGDQVRVTGKKRNDLQDVIAMLRDVELDLPLQFNNFRD